MSETVRVAPYFEGIPGAAQGGYLGGLVARSLGPSAEISLKSLPPLDRVLTVDREDGALVVRDGDTVVMKARPASLELDLPEPVGLADAEEASRRYQGLVDHIFPTCFVCGPARADGLRIFPGRVEGRDLVATPWISTGGSDGAIPVELVWAVFDCVSYWALEEPRGPMLTGAMAFRSLEPLPPEPHVVVGWPLGAEGRKNHAGCAVFSTDGQPRAYGSATWISVDEDIIRRLRGF